MTRVIKIKNEGTKGLVNK